MGKMLITGGAGFIGSTLGDRVLEEGHALVVVDDLSTGRREYVPSGATFYEGKVQGSGFAEVVQKEKPDILFHLAAIPRVPLSVEDPVGTAEANIQGTINVFHAALKAGVKRVVFASSSAVYGEQERLPLVETMTPKPISPYGLQKFVGEQFAKLFSELYHLPIISLRFFNVYGPRLDFDSNYSLVLGKFLRQRSQGQALTVYGDGEQTRAFCYVDDVVSALWKAAGAENLKGGEVVNVGAAESHSVNHLAELIGGEVVHGDPRPGDVRHTQADLSRARELLGWEPRTQLEEGIAKTRTWFEQNQATA